MSLRFKPCSYLPSPVVHGVFVWQTDKPTMTLSPSVRAALGLAVTFGLNECPVAHVLDLIHPADVGRVREETARSKMALTPLRLNYRIRNVQGHYRHVAFEGCWTVCEDGAPLAVSGIVSEIDRPNERTPVEEMEDLTRRIQDIAVEQRMDNIAYFADIMLLEYRGRCS